VPTDLIAQAVCPCGRLNAAKKPSTFAACCSRFLNDFDNMPAPDAESLMRSRYSAFALSRRDYLKATWHSSTRPADVDADAGIKWLGLEVRRHAVLNETHAEVEFIARYKLQGRATRIHELSRFVFENGCWYYVAGDLL
jgi:SEC-C motif domain protein